jgi:hypothetical protein
MHPVRSVPFTQAAQFDQETEAVSVRKAKNIASEVVRKRTNRKSLLFASSIGFPPFPSPRESRAILIPEIDLVFAINPCKGVESVVNRKSITISNCYDNVYEEQKCNFFCGVCLEGEKAGRSRWNLREDENYSKRAFSFSMTRS